ncbi:MAG: hypothetical protein R3250_04850 [Melioribacteraceae bacterium]|nr:hypothetical protein [Melioribacteraceae bacterium]
MEDHTKVSWKNDSVITRLNNSVDNVTLAMGQALTNPSEQAILHVQDMIEHADRSIENALEKEGSTEPIRTLQERLNQTKDQFNTLH